MKTYKLYIRPMQTIADAAYSINEDGSMTSFIFDPANTDYQQFKKDVLEGAELQDADGVVLSKDNTTAFIATLP